MFNPILAILHNQKTQRYHPILFLEAPLPGPPEANKPIRHKSKFHHTEGFEKREEALTCLDTVLAKAVESQWGLPKKATSVDMPWDGEDIPATVAFFVEVDGVWKHAF